MKWNYSTSEFLDHIKRIYEFNESSTTIPKGSTSQAYGDGNGARLEIDDDIV